MAMPKTGMRLALCLICTVLLQTVAVKQEAPQRVEEVTEIRWCEYPRMYVLERITWIRVDGHEAGQVVESSHLWSELRTAGYPGSY